LELEKSYHEVYSLFELCEKDPLILAEIVECLQGLKKKIEKIEIQKLLSKEEDVKNAIVSIHAGAGGTESQDWAQILFRMYQHWASSKGFKLQMIDSLMGEEAGIKSITFSVNGHYAYGLLQSEAGIHRLIRVSPFDTNSRRHTSFTSVFVSPEVEDHFEIDIRPNDLRIDVFRSGGKGGQGVNTTDSAVRITHLSTGIVVSCQQERSQIKNKEIAMRVLRSRLYERHLKEERLKKQVIEDSKKDISWGNQARTYVLHPYRQVRDHRTGWNGSQVEKILDGELDDLIKAYLNCQFTGKWVSGED